VKTRKRRAARALLHQTYNRGYNAGYDAGYSSGYNLGFQKGEDAYAAGFEGTSIVIPTINQQKYLADCIESIGRFTPEPHEIIVIDNGSTDGTADYLRSLPRNKVRFKCFDRNLGFAGAVNQGLMMARGSTILFLNNDTVVTEKWLANLLACLEANPRHGLVGPVTNYISGDQLIKTTYGTMEEMHRFARAFNRLDASKWTATERLTGFCVLMRRDVFRRIGYLDEGFEIGNCEDDDYGFRCRLLGLDLIIAKDTFIHHVGSTTIKTLTPAQFEEMYARNLAFYSGKWGDTREFLAAVSAHWEDGRALASNDFYPTRILVKGPGPEIYWVENGIRRPMAHPPVGVPVTRVSQVDLKNWPLGEPIAAEEWGGIQAELASAAQQGRPLAEGAIVQTPDGRLHQHQGGKLRRLATAWVLEAWNLNRYPVRMMTEAEAAVYPSGLPLIAPPVIKADNL
jgi:GT2 family glycosyltransferase